MGERDIHVPGCTCHERTQEQLDVLDVCDACVRYFDLDRVSAGLNWIADVELPEDGDG